MSGDRASEPSGRATADVATTLDLLQQLLEQQLELAHEGRLAAVESLCEQTGPLVQTIVADGILAKPEGTERRQALLHLYQGLCLTLTAQREEVSAALRVINQRRRMLKTYGSSPV